ncbi:hypothetical protein Chor_013596 [Crotalus horridus]
MEVSVLEIHLEKLLKLGGAMLESGRQFCSHSKSFASGIQDLSQNSSGDTLMSGCLEKFSKSLNRMMEQQQELLETAQQSLKQQLQTLVKEDIKHFKETRKEFERGSEGLASALHHNAEVPRRRHHEAEDAVVTLKAARTTFRNRALDYVLQDLTQDDDVPEIQAEPGQVVMEGYLRWFSIQNSQLVYQKKAKDGLTVVVEDLRLCTVKLCPDHERRFCFEVVSPSKSCLLQADSERHLQAWMCAVQSSIASAYNEDYPESPGQPLERSTSLSATLQSPSSRKLRGGVDKQVVDQVQRLEGNAQCCDCREPAPEWASINLGITLCIESLGVHFSKVRSLTLDAWEPELVKLMSVLGNRVINQIYEARVEEMNMKRPQPGSSRLACLFLKRGANMNAVDGEGKDPLGIAIDSANADIVTLLRLAKMREAELALGQSADLLLKPPTQQLEKMLPLEDPPDGGWGWMVVLAGFLANSLTFGVLRSLGALSEGLVGAFEATTAQVSWVTGITLATKQFASNRRSLAVGLALTGNGLASFAFSPLLRLVADHLAWRGTLLAASALTLHLVPGGALLRPLALRGDPPKLTALFDLGLFAQRGFGAFVLGTALLAAGYFVPYVHLDAYGRALGMGAYRAAFVVSLAGLADALARLLAGCVADRHLLPPVYLLVAFNTLVGVSLLFFPASSASEASLLALALLYGASAGSFATLAFGVLPELVGVGRVVNATGLCMMSMSASCGTKLETSLPRSWLGGALSSVPVWSSLPFPPPRLMLQPPAGQDARCCGASETSPPHDGQETFGNMKDIPHSSLQGLPAMPITAKPTRMMGV